MLHDNVHMNINIFKRMLIHYYFVLHVMVVTQMFADISYCTNQKRVMLSVRKGSMSTNHEGFAI